MKLEKLPGGVIYDDDETTRISKPDGTMLAAIHRQLAGLAAAAMDEARRPRYAITRDHTIILADEDADLYVVDEARHTIRLGD